MTICRSASPQSCRRCGTSDAAGDRSLLDNPRLVEGDLRPLAIGEAGDAVLAVILGTASGQPHPLRLAWYQPSAPLALTLQHLPLLKKPDLRGVTADPRLPLALRRKAELLLGL